MVGVLSITTGLLLQGATPDPHIRPPDQLIGTFTAISIEVEFLGDCLDPGDGDRTDARFKQLNHRYSACSARSKRSGDRP